MKNLTKKEKQLTTLIVLFVIPCLLAFVKPTPAVVKKDKKLADALAHIEGYRVVKNIKLDEATIKFLDLDDYVFTTYEKDGVPITLFIGFYYTAEKVSAAHSPLVCFPGQGWVISEPDYGKQKVDGHAIEYARIAAEQGDQKELVVYWYQSHDDTSTQVYLNKLNTVINKVTKGDQRHAFVRISVPNASVKPQLVRQTLTEFMRIFYPRFMEFVTI